MSPKGSPAAEAAARIFHVDRLARLHVGQDCATSQRTRPSDGTVVYTVSRPGGVGREVVAYGDYDEVIVQLTSRRDAAAQRGAEERIE